MEESKITQEKRKIKAGKEYMWNVEGDREGEM